MGNIKSISRDIKITFSNVNEEENKIQLKNIRKIKDSDLWISEFKQGGTVAPLDRYPVKSIVNTRVKNAFKNHVPFTEVNYYTYWLKSRTAFILLPRRITWDSSSMNTKYVRDNKLENISRKNENNDINWLTYATIMEGMRTAMLDGLGIPKGFLDWSNK